EIPVANAASSSSSGSNCCTCNCQPALQAILQELKTMRKIMQIQAAAQDRPQPLVPLATLPKSTVSRKRNKKKKATPKTVKPLAVKQEPGPGENSRKLPANLDRLSVEAAEASVKTEPLVSGFGIVLESSSSDVSGREAVSGRQTLAYDGPFKATTALKKKGLDSHFPHLTTVGASPCSCDQSPGTWQLIRLYDSC
ncbi:BEN domain-containing protein 7-like, partial [Notechis scutatus]|uniref:BEN domain-containing protein 7-like n=1 Tax=Notechis scutatus TaxID=8663 RepID=A0A6J1W9U4_9SAUR